MQCSPLFLVRSKLTALCAAHTLAWKGYSAASLASATTVGMEGRTGAAHTRTRSLWLTDCNSNNKATLYGQFISVSPERRRPPPSTTLVYSTPSYALDSPHKSALWSRRPSRERKRETKLPLLKDGSVNKDIKPARIARALKV